MFLSDGAIKDEKDDELNRAEFSKKLREKILDLGENAESKVIALYGDWAWIILGCKGS